MERASIKTPHEIDRFRSLVAKASEIAIQNIKREVDYSDAPEEFRGNTPEIWQEQLVFHFMFILCYWDNI